MIDIRAISRTDFRIYPILLCLMIISLLVISAMTGGSDEWTATGFWTPLVKSQLKWFCLGWGVFFFFACFDYRKLREYSLFIYIGSFFCKPRPKCPSVVSDSGSCKLSAIGTSKACNCRCFKLVFRKKGKLCQFLSICPRNWADSWFPLSPYFKATRSRNRSCSLSNHLMHGVFCRIASGDLSVDGWGRGSHFCHCCPHFYRNYRSRKNGALFYEVLKRVSIPTSQSQHVSSKGCSLSHSNWGGNGNGLAQK